MLKTQNNIDNNKSCDLIRGKALYFLGRREYSQFELQKKLKDKFPEEVFCIRDVINEFIAKNWISDIRYAEEFVREKSQYSKWGPIKITQQLREKGVEKEIIESTLKKVFSEKVQREVVMQLAKEKWRLLHKKTAPKRKVAVQSFLLSRGFTFHVVLDVMEHFKQEEKGLPEDL
jgi:regulatory protein